MSMRSVAGLLAVTLVVSWCNVGRGQLGMVPSPSAFGGGMGGLGTAGLGGSGGRGFSTGGLGPSGFGNAGFGATRFGGSGLAAFGGGGFGNAGFGATRFGSGLGSTAGGSMFGNQMGGTNRLGGGSTYFVGRDAASMAATFSQFSRAGAQFFNQMNRDYSRRQRSSATAQPAGRNANPVRVELQVAFDGPRKVPSAVEDQIRARLGRILAQHQIVPPVVRMEGDTAVLVGEASSESQRLMFEKLVALEPGVRQVRNEVVVVTTPATASDATAPN